MTLSADALPSPGPRLQWPFFRDTRQDPNSDKQEDENRVAKQAQQTYLSLLKVQDHIQSTSRILPTECAGTNTLTLTLCAGHPVVPRYLDFETFGFVAAATSTGVMTVQVLTSDGVEVGSALKAYVSNGGTQASTGDVTSGRQYFATYCDTLDSGAGGFVLR